MGIPIYDNGNSLPARVLFGMAPPWAKDEHGRSPLLLSALQGDIHTFNALLAVCDHRESHYGMTALHAAMWSGNHSCIKLSLPFSSMDAPDDLGKTPYHFGAEKSDFHIAVVGARNGNPYLQSLDEMNVLEIACANATSADDLMPYFISAFHVDSSRAKIFLPQAVKNASEVANSTVLAGAFRKSIAALSQGGGASAWLALAFDKAMATKTTAPEKWSENNALLQALIFNDAELFNAAMASGANIRYKIDGKTIAVHAVENGLNDLLVAVSKRIASDDIVFLEMIYAAATFDKLDVLDMLADLSPPDRNMHDGRTPLQKAVDESNVSAIRNLLPVSNPLRRTNDGLNILDKALMHPDPMVREIFSRMMGDKP